MPQVIGNRDDDDAERGRARGRRLFLAALQFTLHPAQGQQKLDVEIGQGTFLDVAEGVLELIAEVTLDIEIEGSTIHGAVGAVAVHGRTLYIYA